MFHQLQHKISTGRGKATRPANFIMFCMLAFVAGVSVTAYFCASMNQEMKMPGGWTMSMMWMRMPGQTWFASALSFQLMWLAMMVAMMLPSALPMFLKTKRNGISLCYMASGYFAVWLLAGIGIYALGIKYMILAMQSELFSRSVPLASGTFLVAAGTIQFGRWKRRHLLRCRSSLGCAVSFPQSEPGFRLGCKQGLACCACCAAPMMTLLAIGMMNPIAMTVVAIVIAAEKMLPRPEITSRLVGIAAIVTGSLMIVTSFGF